MVDGRDGGGDGRGWCISLMAIATGVTYELVVRFADKIGYPEAASIIIPVPLPKCRGVLQGRSGGLWSVDIGLFVRVVLCDSNFESLFDRTHISRGVTSALCCAGLWSVDFVDETVAFSFFFPALIQNASGQTLETVLIAEYY
jgi:hypothetical protein